MKKIRIAWATLITSIILFPSLVSAQTGVAKVKSGLGDIGSIINTLTNSVVKSLATLFATAAMVAFSSVSCNSSGGRAMAMQLGRRTVRISCSGVLSLYL
jgi:hypothetical protein